MNRLGDRIGVALLFAGLLVAFREPLVAMASQWSANPMYTHGFAVPVISLGLLWSQRRRLKSLAIRPAWLAATPVLGAALLMLVLGRIAAVQVVQQLAFVLAIAGGVLLVWGRDHLKVSGPAIAYLLFMVPFWDALTEPLHAPFQLGSARLGTSLMVAAGVPASLDGTFIRLPTVVLEVARACSGVNYLIAVLALALPLAFVYLRDWWRRVALITSALVIAALANGLRVGVIGVLAFLDIGSPLHGPFHVLQGLFVAGVGYLALFVGLGLLEAGDTKAPVVDVPVQAPPIETRRWRGAEAFVLALVFWGVALPGVVHVAAAPVPLARPLDELSPSLGAWKLVPETPFDRVGSAGDAWPGADHVLRRTYSRSDRMASVEVWYFAEQRQDREMVSFRSAELHRRATSRNIPIGSGRHLTVNALTWPEQRRAALFWYEFDGSPESSEYMAKLRSAWSTLSTGRSAGAAIMVTAATSDGVSDVLLASLENLAVEVHTGLARHWTTSTLQE